jgi:plastocyanin
MLWTRGVVLSLAALVTSGMSGHSESPDVGDPGIRVGSIEGQVAMPKPRIRRTADRYPGATAGTANAVQSIPAVVFLRGRVPGARFETERVRLAQNDTSFVPAVAVIPVGGIVEFPNHDPFFHNVFSYSSPARFDLGRYPQGESKQVRFEEAGIVRVYCEVHETMRSAVIVNENPFYAVLQPDGSFSIRNVPEGRYELELWHPDVRGKVVPIVVESGKATRVSLQLS